MSGSIGISPTLFIFVEENIRIQLIMHMKTLRRLFVVCLFALAASVSSLAQVGGDMDRARLRDLERQQQQRQYNDFMNKDFGKGSLSGFGMVEDYAPFEKACPVFVRGGASVGMSDGSAIGYNASIGVQFGGFKGLIFNPEIGIGSRFIDDRWGDMLNDYAVELSSLNLKVRPIQAGASFCLGPMAMSAYGGLYASYDLYNKADYRVIRGSAGKQPEYHPLDLGAGFALDFVFYRCDISFVFDFGFVPMFTDGPCWSECAFRLGFWL